MKSCAKQSIENNTDGTMQVPLVSVVVMSYNSAATIVETLDSIKAQTYQNLELIVTDDCSPAGKTLEIIQNWLDANGSRFVYADLVTTDKNTGVSGNINRGVAKSHGEWIKSIAGDDLLIPTAIEEYVNFVANHSEKVRMCVCDVEPFVNDGEVPKRVMVTYARYFMCESENYENQRKRVMTDLVFVGPAYFYSRELFDEVGGFSEKYGCAEEWPFVYKVIMGGNRIYALDKKLVRYRVQNSSLCHSRDDKGLPNKRMLNGFYAHYFGHAFRDLIRDGRPLVAWHYALFYWGLRIKYNISNRYLRKAVGAGLLALSPLAYYKWIKELKGDKL